MTSASVEPASPDAESRAADHVQRNIAAIAQIEKAALEQRSPSERLSGAIAGFAGTMTFVLLHFVGFGVWVVVNRQTSPIRFDAFPYSVLNLALAA